MTGLRHPAELPFFIFMVLLNVLIIGVIVQAAVMLPFLPERFADSGWATAVRSALIALLLLIPTLFVIRETQRASVRGTAVHSSARFSQGERGRNRNGDPAQAATKQEIGDGRRHYPEMERDQDASPLGEPANVAGDEQGEQKGRAAREGHGHHGS